jgi:hypothetical protein
MTTNLTAGRQVTRITRRRVGSAHSRAEGSRRIGPGARPGGLSRVRVPRSAAVLFAAADRAWRSSEPRPPPPDRSLHKHHRRSGRRWQCGGTRSTAERHNRWPSNYRHWLTGPKSSVACQWRVPEPSADVARSSVACQWRVPDVCACCIRQEHQREVWESQRAATAGSPHRPDERSARAAGVATFRPRRDPATRPASAARAVRFWGGYEPGVNAGPVKYAPLVPAAGGDATLARPLGGLQRHAGEPAVARATFAATDAAWKSPLALSIVETSLFVSSALLRVIRVLAFWADPTRPRAKNGPRRFASGARGN